MRIAFVFPGQGAQKTGMGLDLYEHSENVKKLYEKADKILGFSLSEMCFRGSEEDLKQTINTQPAIYVMSVAISQLLKENGINPGITAGHSIGEYAALTTAGVISFEEGIKLVRERGRLMNEAGIKAPGTMAAIMGMKFDDVKKYCEEASEAGIVEVANFNSPEQIVISGEIAGVEKAMEIMKANGAKRVVPLKVGAAFHSRLMKEAGEIFAKLLDKAEFKKPEIPVVSNSNARISTDPEELRTALKAQMLGSVIWVDSIKAMANHGTEIFVEAGPGKALCGMIKKTDVSLKTMNVETMETLEKVINELKN
ncbi:ACP S-malonyltransferase [bacterium]|nr:ACP S-malonyltransferase [bacterium]